MQLKWADSLEFVPENITYFLLWLMQLSLITEILGGPESCHCVISPNFPTQNGQLQKGEMRDTNSYFTHPMGT